MEEYARVLGSLYPDYEISIIDNPINMCWVVRVSARPSLGWSYQFAAEDVVSHYQRAMMAEADFVLHLKTLVERAINHLDAVRQPARKCHPFNMSASWGVWGRGLPESWYLCDSHTTAPAKPKYSQAELDAWDSYDMEGE